MRRKSLPSELKPLVFGSAKKLGVYFLFSGEEVVYVGSSRNILNRVGQHSLDKDFDSVQWIETTPDLMRPTEGRWILAFKPKYNGYIDARGVRIYNAPKQMAIARIPGVLSKRLKRLMNKAFGDLHKEMVERRLSGDAK